jgi:ribosome-binding protein aMBF1 (putative translation factor)
VENEIEKTKELISKWEKGNAQKNDPAFITMNEYLKEDLKLLQATLEVMDDGAKKINPYTEFSKAWLEKEIERTKELISKWEKGNAQKNDPAFMKMNEYLKEDLKLLQAALQKVQMKLFLQ